jgi:hypothetical protein
MKIIKVSIIALLFGLSFGQLYGQSKDHLFSYKPLGNGVKATPVFESYSLAGKEQAVFYAENLEYYESFFNNIVKQSLTKEKYDALNKDKPSRIVFDLDSEGKFHYATFWLRNSDQDVLTDSDLYTLYRNLKKSSLNMSKMSIRYDGKKTDSLYYGSMSATFFPILLKK